MTRAASPAARHLIVCRHFDDAALALGSVLAEHGTRVTVATVCGGVPEPDVAPSECRPLRRRATGIASPPSSPECAVTPSQLVPLAQAWPMLTALGGLLATELCWPVGG